MNNVWTLFWTFLKIGLFSIGGGYAIMPAIREQVVDQTGWISPKMFTDIITISQMTPGPLAVNTSTFAGLQIGGIPGAVAATCGCVLCGILLSLSLYLVIQKKKDSACVFEIVQGLKSASLGLIVSAAATILSLAFFGAEPSSDSGFYASVNLLAVVVFLCILLLIRKWKLNPILIMLISGAAGLCFYL